MLLERLESANAVFGLERRFHLAFATFVAVDVAAVAAGVTDPARSLLFVLLLANDKFILYIFVCRSYLA